MIRQRKPRAVLLAYDAEAQAILMCSTDNDAATKLMRGALVVPWTLEEFDYKLDDDFARKFAGTIVSMLAAHQPVLKPYVHITKDPHAIDQPEPPIE